MRVEYHPVLEKELIEIRDYYNGCSEGLGGEFVEAFDLLITSIVTMPTRWMKVDGDIRRALLKRFPYIIYFRILGEESIRVTVIKHEKRHPAFGLKRR